MIKPYQKKLNNTIKLKGKDLQHGDSLCEVKNIKNQSNKIENVYEYVI